MEYKHRVLIVEDDPDVAHLVKTVVSMKGYSPVCVPTVRLARQIIKRERFRKVILDLVLPEIQGEEFWSELIFEDYPLEDILILSGHYLRQKAMRDLGAVCVSKPFSLASVTRFL